jgi:catechol 2,3-dioxygenase-like lactoylglutathione lyase family enzyme
MSTDMPVIISGFDHIALTVTSLDAAVDFYTRVLGMREASSGPGQRAVAFGDKHINLNPAGGISASNASESQPQQPQPQQPRPRNPTPGSADLCLVTPSPLEALVAHLAAVGVKIEEGPVRAEGANGPVTSVFIRDPDGNSIEVASYDSL